MAHGGSLSGMAVRNRSIVGRALVGLAAAFSVASAAPDSAPAVALFRQRASKLLRGRGSDALPTLFGGGSRMDRNVWTGQDSSLDFRHLDDLNPVAPFDRVADPRSGINQISSVQPAEATGLDRLKQGTLGKESLFVPPYMRPDAFPADAETHGDEDPTFASGDVYSPQIVGGIVAPEDAMPRDAYPIQASPDRSHPLQVGWEDRIGKRYARYMDQVEARAEDCDTVSEECTTPCRKNDHVKAQIGNTVFDAVILSAHIGNVLKIQFTPGAAKDTSASVPCGVEAQCTIFRPCQPSNGSPCVEQIAQEIPDFAGNLQTTHQCPGGANVCATIQQMMPAGVLRLGGKACRAAPGVSKTR